MKVLLIGGFLGSGKTTMLLKIAKRLTAIPSTVAIIENEIGEIGIDGRYISGQEQLAGYQEPLAGYQGLHVTELFGGCVCCTMKTSLRTTIEKIECEIDPDWVLLEPTGAAYPGDIVENSISGFGFIESCRVLILIDPGRYRMLLEMMTPLIQAQLDSADVVAINKIDDAEKKAVDFSLKSVKTLLKHEMLVVKISAETGSNIDLVLDALL
jgi:G3E family GTPase